LLDPLYALARVHALILSGGGARGAFEAGVATALYEQEHFDLICGTSIGALNGAALAQDQPELLRDTWREIAARNVLRLDPRLESWRRFFSDLRKVRLAHAASCIGKLRIPAPSSITGLLDWAPIRGIIEPRYFFERLKHPFMVGTTDLTHGIGSAFYAFPGDPERAASFAAAEPNAYPMTADNFIDTICASAAVPGAFPPVTIDIPARGPTAFVDGCIANNTPIRQAIDAGATRLTMIFMQHSALRTRDARVRHIGDVVATCQDISDERMLDLDLKLARTINSAVLRGHAPDKRFVDIRVIGPSVPLRLASLAFADQAAIDRVFMLGVEEGRNAASD